MKLLSSVSDSPRPPSTDSLSSVLYSPPPLPPLRVHVPKWGILGPQSPYIGGTLRPKYSLFRYMDP